MPSCDCIESENFQVLIQDCNSICNVAEETPRRLCILSEHSFFFFYFHICFNLLAVPCGMWNF